MKRQIIGNLALLRQRNLRLFPQAARRRAAAFRQETLRDLREGRRTPRLGVKACHCKRLWNCARCGEPFRCWKTWPFLWDRMPRRFQKTKLCRTCYGDLLLDGL